MKMKLVKLHRLIQLSWNYAGFKGHSLVQVHHHTLFVVKSMRLCYIMHSYQIFLCKEFLYRPYLFSNFTLEEVVSFTM